MQKWWPWITGLVVIGGIVWTFFYMKDVHPLGAQGTNLGKNRTESVGIEFKGATLVGRSEGKKIWEINSETVEMSKDRRLATFRGKTSGVLLQNGRKVAAISASEATYNTFTRNVSAPKTTELTLVDGPTFKVHNIWWNSHTSRLYCQSADALLDGGTMHAEKLTADLNKKELTASKVKGLIKIKE